MAGITRFRPLQKLILNRLSTPVSQSGVLAQPTTKTSLYSRRAINTTRALRKEVDQCKPKKTWVSYGFNNDSAELDRHFSYAVPISCITLVMVVGGYILAYCPDFLLKDWALREAYLELRRREAMGLPPIDPNLIDPSKVMLPTDEELGDQEIII